MFLKFLKTTLFCLLIQVLPAQAIYPENIGTTQYGIGYLAAADKLDRDARRLGDDRGWSREKSRRLYTLIEDGITAPASGLSRILSRVSEDDRKGFIRMLVHLQEVVSEKSPWLFMIGRDRAVATDGHHKVRSLQRLNDMLTLSSERWRTETRKILSDADRVDRAGRMRTRLPFSAPEVLGRYPANVKAAEVMRGILSQRMGLWENPEDTALARRFYGPEASRRASVQDLNRLASSLGIEDSPTGLSFIPIREVRDNPTRTLMGVYFETRGLKEGDVGFIAYTEFFVGDHVRELAQQDPQRYRSIIRFLSPETTIQQQRELLPAALNEVDALYANRATLAAATLELASQGARDVERLLNKLKRSYCRANPL